MFWIIVIAIVGYILFKFLSDANKDNYDLAGKSLAGKFSVVVNMINEAAFENEAQVIETDKRSFSLWKEGVNQMVNFVYGTGNLTITWNYKYFQKEIVHKKSFMNVRNLSIFEQQRMGEVMIAEMGQVVEKHKNDVISDAF